MLGVVSSRSGKQIRNRSGVRWKCKTRLCQNKPPSDDKNVDEDAAIELWGSEMFHWSLEQTTAGCSWDYCASKKAHSGEKSNKCTYCASKNRKAGYQTFSSCTDRSLAQSHQIRRRKKILHHKPTSTSLERKNAILSNRRLVCFESLLKFWATKHLMVFFLACMEFVSKLLFRASFVPHGARGAVGEIHARIQSSKLLNVQIVTTANLHWSQKLELSFSAQVAELFAPLCLSWWSRSFFWLCPLLFHSLALSHCCPIFYPTHCPQFNQPFPHLWPQASKSKRKTSKLKIWNEKQVLWFLVILKGTLQNLEAERLQQQLHLPIIIANNNCNCQ